MVKGLKTHNIRVFGETNWGSTSLSHEQSETQFAQNNCNEGSTVYIFIEM